ncbi:MAG TPA: gliding motility-associated C-terminal domain-containing protein [Saprospiraceae bacterium]|nr:gliding motility-associated C-terminal domain-containing protein [Saprospiraceae bacterium]
MKKFLFGILFLYLLVGFLIPKSYTQIWSENFNAYPNGTLNGPPFWSSVATDCDDGGNLNLGVGNSQWGVWAGRFVCEDIEGAPCCGGMGGGNDNYWLSQSIDISNYCNVSISITFTSTGVLECSAGGPYFICTGNPFIDNSHDQIVTYYSLDGGPFVQFAYVCGNTGIGILSVGGLNGSTLQIKASMANKANGETFFMDDVVVNGTIHSVPAISGIPASICQSASPIALATTQSGITGNWSGMGVAGNNFNPSGLSGSITLTFTPNAGQCANPNTTTINVNLPVTPTISGIPATICELAASIALPTTQSGYTGNWSGTGVSGNNFDPSGLSGNITLTFTPTAGQCATTNTTGINVNVPVTPTISGLPATLCENDPSAALATTQSGITGNWSGSGVSGNSFDPSGLSGNITLTFTPNAGQCANPNTAVIDVNTAVTPAISGLPASLCQSDSPVSLPTTQSGITGTWSGMGITGNNFNPAGLSGNITLTFTPTVGQCANPATASITVNIPVTPAISGIPASICQNDSPIALPTSQSGFTGTWSGMGVTANNFNPSGLSGNITLTFTPAAGQCANTNTTNINVNIPVTPAISGLPASMCQNDSPVALPTTESGITGTWSGMGVAGNNFNPSGLNGNITLTFTPNAGQCANNASASIIVNVAVTPAISGLPASICQTAAPIALPTTQSGITGNWSGMGVAGNNFNPTGLSGNITLTFTPTAPQCANINTTNINVTIAVTPVISGIPASICQNSAPIALPTTQSGITGNWTGMGVAGNNFNPTGLSGNITLTFTPNAAQCANVNTTSIAINIPVTPAITGIPASLCQTAAPISLPTTQGGFTGNWSGMGVAGNNFNPAGLSGSIALTFTPTAGQCANNAGISITVNIPVTPAIMNVPATLCESAAPINLSTTQSGINGIWSGQGVSGNSFDPSGLNGNITLTFTPNAGQCALQATTGINVVNAPSFSNLVENCNLVNQTYTVTFTITGGNPGTYTVNGMPVGSSFTSSPIASGTGYVFNLNDGNNCGPVVISGSVDCNCATTAGTMNFANAPLNICDGSGFTVIHNGNDMLDGNDVLEFILHTNAGAQLGTIIAVSATNSFSFPGGIVLGQTYYVSAVAGNNNGFGLVDLNDNCLSVSQGIPVIFYAPAVSFTNGGVVCENQCWVFQVQFTGFAPFTVDYTIHAGGNDFLESMISVSNTLSVTVCAEDYGVSNGPIQIFATNMTDANCQVDFNNPVIQTITVQPFHVNNLAMNLCPGEEIVVNGTIYNQGHPIGTETLLNASTNGCDSLVNVNLTFYNASIFDLTQTLCTGGSLTVNGTVYDASHPMGTEVIPNGNIHGCDSTINVNLSFNNVVTFDLNTTLCIGGSIVVNGTTFNQANPTGSETFIGGSYLGCDSVVNVNLSFYAPAVFNLNQTLCTGGSITVNGTVYDAAHPTGTEVIPNASVHACDSTINVNLSFNNVVTFDLTNTLCFGGSIVVNGTTYNAGNSSGSETFIGGSYLGCDSVVNINLSFYPQVVFSLNQTLCAGQSLVINGTIYNQAHPAGQEILANANIHGCDSTVNVNLSFNAAPTFNLNQTLCPGGSITVHGTIYNAAHPTGTETFIGGSHLGCDSIVNVSVTFYGPSVFNLTQTLCTGGSLTVNGTIYNAGNPTGTEVLLNANVHGCDSTVNVNLSFNSVVINDLTQSLCPGESIVVNGTTYNASHPTGSETLVGGSYLGCDSMINVNLSFHAASDFNLVQTLCIGGSVTINGTVYNELNPTGTELLPNASVFGCDSTVNINLSFSSVVTFDLDETLCPGGSLVINGTTYNEANPTGTEAFIGGSYLGCDSIVNISLTFYAPDVFVLDSILLEGQSITVNGTIYDESNPTGTEVINGGSVFGCDSTIMINLTFEEVVTVIKEIFVPTVFSPNDDGFNDLVHVFGSPQVQIHFFRIYDRWGSMLYEYSNFQPNDLSIGWDGRFKNQMVNPGVYVWLAKVKFVDGQEKVFTGDVTLVR